MRNLFILLLVCSFILSGCSSEEVPVAQVEDYKVETNVVEYDAKIVPIKKEIIKIDETMNVVVKNAEDVTVGSVLYEIIDNKSVQQVESIKYELDLDYAELKKVNDNILATSLEDPMLITLREQRDSIDRKIKTSEFNLKTYPTGEKVTAKFNGKVAIDNQTGDLIITSNDYGVELNSNFETLKEILDQKVYISVDDRNYDLSFENYLPLSGQGQTSGDGYKVFYKIVGLDKSVIDSQPVALKRDSTDVFVPVVYLVELDGKNYLKVNGSTLEVEVENMAGRVKVLSGVNVGDTISIIGEDDDIFKEN
jgi:hypothetical protein